MSEFQDNTVSSSGIENSKEQPPPLITMDDEPYSTSETTSKTVFHATETVPVRPKLTTDGMMDGFQVEHTTSEVKLKHAKNGVADLEGLDKSPVPSSTALQAGCKLTSWPAVWLIRHKVDDRIIRLVYWTEWQRTAGVFGGILFLLLSLTCYPLVSVITMFGLSLLSVAFLYRVSMTIVNAVQKTSAEHPLRHLLDEKIELPDATVRQWSEHLRTGSNRSIARLQRLFLIEDVFESFKFGVLLWLASYVGSCFDLLTLAILSVVAVFTLPKVYELYQGQIDQACVSAKIKLLHAVAMVEAKVPAKIKFYNKEKKAQ